MIGKVLQKSKSAIHIDLDKPIIKRHYYPPTKSAPLTELKEAERIKLEQLKLSTVNTETNKPIEELLESARIDSSEKGIKGKVKGVKSYAKEKSCWSDSGVSNKSEVKAVFKPRDMRKSLGTVCEGEGSYEYDNKFFKYEGQWKNSKKHGKGKLTFLDGSYYEGTFQNGEIEGFGTKYFAGTGCKYQGQFVHGELHGKGRMTWPDGSIYEGQWVNNRRHGFAIMKSVEQNCLYKGMFHSNKRHGQGMMIYPQGDRYDGEWLMDNRHGEGDMRFMDGTVYEGHFEDDNFCGEGVMRHCSGLIYQGTWLNGSPTILPTKLVIVNPVGKEPNIECIQGQPFDIQVKCVDNNGNVVKEDNRRELRISAGFKHIKAKKGTALFDLIEEYEEKPMATPYYEVLQYPLTDFMVEEEEPNEDEELKDENEDTFTESQGMQRNTSRTGLIAEDEENEQTSDIKSEEGKERVTPQAETPATEQTPGTERRQSNISIPETPMSGITATTPAPVLDGPALEKESCPLPPPVANKRSEKGQCEWKNIMLAQAPPRFPPFVALDEEERKLHARQNKQVEAKRLNRLAHDDRFARIGEYVIMVHDVTDPPFMDTILEPAFILVKLKKPKREKKPKEVKPKWDTSKHIADAMTRS